MANMITVEELKSNLNEFVLLDVREPDELSSKIENSTSMPLGLVIRNAKKGFIEDLKSKKICTYCASGYRGNIAADELQKAGFNVVNLRGGFMAWNES
ncbi:MAG: rhodanese-like domain-containing protein [Candidatus Nitrosoabyssus spongiisocia]|nr:MAG: rhodanese-like domain-containing protein [Nitrosopumilaceae archaeon AB1(1)]